MLIDVHLGEKSGTNGLPHETENKVRLTKTRIRKASIIHDEGKKGRDSTLASFRSSAPIFTTYKGRKMNTTKKR